MRHLIAAAFAMAFSMLGTPVGAENSIAVSPDVSLELDGVPFADESVAVDDLLGVTVRVWLAIEYERDGLHEEAQQAAGEALAVRPDLSVEEAVQILAPGRENFSPAEYAQIPGYLSAAGFR